MVSMSRIAMYTPHLREPFERILCPYGAVGDQLWVRESFKRDPHNDCMVFYRDGTAIQCNRGTHQSEDYVHNKWRSGMFMPRWACRTVVQITDVRVQRVQDISNDDAIAEGVQPLFDKATAKSRPEFNLNPMPWMNYLWHGYVGHTITAKQSNAWEYQYSSYKNASGSYSSLWDSINGKKHSWSSNPWVWCLSFRRIDGKET